ncbi:hypothetical protein [Thermoplasma sp.]|uniref:hypothetical protein n=1 Tax=Thermoplasma sp. TaxID=1973142 RepID=UPI00126C0206|nr:hypothetical protein [Thermoplasma sp.]KAA8922256.1 MAG: hypothetical protein F6Q11_05075 [Thermoplasma sp.]
MRRVFDTIIKQREAGEKIGLKADLFMDLYKENKECFRGEQMIMDLLKKYVKDLRKESIDSYKDSILMDSYKKQADALESIYKALTKN